MNARRMAVVTLLLLSPLAGPVPIAADEGPKPDVVLSRCSVEYERSTAVGAVALGANVSVLQDCLVRQGERVKADQVLGRLQSRDIAVEMGLRKAEAENLIDVRFQENRQGLAQVRFNRSVPLREKGLISLLDFQAVQFEKEGAAIAVEKAKFERSLARLRFEMLEVQARNREFRSPHDGVVLEITKHVGEKITANDQVFLVTDVDHLLVVGQLDVSDAWRVKEGQRVRIFPDLRGVDLPIEREPFYGVVAFCDRRIEPSLRTCKVVARVENRDEMLRSGLEANMEIFPDEVADKRRDAPRFAPGPEMGVKAATE